MRNRSRIQRVTYIRNDASGEQLARAGITVVQDRCLMIDYARPGVHR